MPDLTNRQLVEKADLALSDLASNGGVMNADQARTFVRKLIEQPTVLALGRTVIMSAPTQEINKVQFGQRILKPAGTTAEGGSVNNKPARYLAAADRSKVTTSKVTLDTKEVMAEVRVPDEALEDNIEGQSFQDTIIALIAERAALDLEELALLGDSTSGDTYLALKDGFIKQSSVNEVDALNQPLTKTSFRDAIKAMPNPYLRNRASLRFFVSFDQDANLRHTLADRATTGGDSFLLSDQPIRMFGISVEPAALMPDTKMLFGNVQNHIFGVWRQIRVESARDIRSREWIIVLTARVDFKFEEDSAEVREVNIAA